ncbi:MAG: MFS transporter [Firmicutes bacterium]|nr:MFS transporter [Bacillota bacterium]
MQSSSSGSPAFKVTVLSLAHMLNDWYMNFIQTLLPFLIAAGMQLTKGAFLVSIFTVSSSLIQPLAGYLVDQKNQRWMVYVGTLWMSILLSLAGLIENYLVFLVVVMLAGLGTAAFHPQASAMVSSISGERKGFFQAMFMAGGNIGWALTPLMAVPVIERYGLHITPVFIVPGLVVAVMLYLYAPRTQSAAKKQSEPLWPVLREAGPELLKVVSVVAVRSLAYFGLIAFLPLYLQSQGIPLVSGSRMLFMMLFCGAMGGLIGGHLSDTWGRKTVIVGSLLLATPLYYLFMHLGGGMSWISWVLLALAGMSLMSSFSVTTVIAQETISKNAAMAAGLMLGFSIGMGGLGVGLVGMLAESRGIPFAVNFLIWLPLVAALLGMTIKRRPVLKA